MIQLYPDEDAERELLRRHHTQELIDQPLDCVLAADELARLRDLVRRVIVRDEVISYVAALVRASRADVQYMLGASPRAGLQLLRAAKASAAAQERDYVLPEDVQELWIPAMGHRVVLDPAAEVEGLDVRTALSRTLSSVTVPR